MATDTAELQRKLDQQQEEIKALQEAAAKSKQEFEARLKEETYKAKLLKYQKLYNEAFGTNAPPPPLPTFNQPPDPSGKADEVQQSAYEQKMNKDLESENAAEDSDPTGPKISQAIANCLQKWFRTIHSGSEIQTALKQCVRPENADALKVVTLNPEVKKKMQKPDEISDQRLKWLSTAAPKAAQPLVTAWSALSELEFEIQHDQEADQPVTDAFIPLKDDENAPQLNLSQVIRDLKHRIKCLGFVHVQIIQKRRIDLQSKLSGAAKELAEPHQEFDDFLFGQNMDKKLQKILAANKIAHKVSSPQKSRFNPFLVKRRGRGRGGSRGSNNNHPFQQYNWNQNPPNHYYNSNWYQQHQPPPNPPVQQQRRVKGRGPGAQHQSQHQKS